MDENVKRYLDAGIEGKLNIGGWLALILFLGLVPAGFAILAANRDFRAFMPVYLAAVPALYAITFGRLIGSADREGIRRKLGFTQRWVDLTHRDSKLETRRSRDKQGRTHTEQFTATTFTFGKSRFAFSDRFLRNGDALRVFASIAAAHAQPAVFGRELQADDARAALAAFAALPPSKQGPLRPMLAGAKPWLAAVLALGVVFIGGLKARNLYRHASDEEQSASNPRYPQFREGRLEDAARLRGEAGKTAMVAGGAALLAAAAITGGVFGQRAHRRRRTG